MAGNPCPASSPVEGSRQTPQERQWASHPGSTVSPGHTPGRRGHEDCDSPPSLSCLQRKLSVSRFWSGMLDFTRQSRGPILDRPIVSEAAAGSLGGEHTVFQPCLSVTMG